jgi:hypothetical protein
VDEPLVDEPLVVLPVEGLAEGVLPDVVVDPVTGVTPLPPATTDVAELVARGPEVEVW